MPLLHERLFGEDQARYIVTGAEALTLPEGHTISLDGLREAHETWLPAYMDGE